MNQSQGCLPSNDVNGFISSCLPSTTIEQLCENLRNVNARVSDEFLALAAVLQSNSTQARKITEHSHKSTGSEATLQSRRAVGVLQRILGDAAGVSGMVEVSTENMMDILAHVTAARRPLERLKQMRSLLQTVGVLSRIEGGRISNTDVDLSGLSKDIDVLAKEVHQHVNRIFDDSAKLSVVLQNGVGELKRFGQEERLQTAELIQRTQSVLDPMIARSETLQKAALAIDEQYTGFHRSTDQIVMSLQSQDIARQRMEHVEEAIYRVAAALDAGESMESCAGVLSVQRSQLVSTRDLLADSVRAIHSGLESLGPRIKELVSRTALLAQQTDKDGESFAELIDSGQETVSTVFKQCSSSVKAVVSIVNSVLPSVEKMTAGACSLTEIETSIHFISMNAAMKTVQLGREGIAMGVIATELREITKKSEGDTKAVLNGLSSIGDALAKITGAGGMADGSLMTSDDGEAVGSEFMGLSESVRASSQQMKDGLNQVRKLADGLCIDLERGCALAVGAASLTALFDSQLFQFDEVFGELGYSEEMSASAGGSNQTEDLSVLYSMESERKLHLEVFGGASMEQGKLASDLDDGVELF